MKYRYLLWCANEHVEFRIPELKAIASTFKIPVEWLEKPEEDPYVIVGVKSEKDACQLVSRSMLVRSCYHLWGEGKSLSDVHASVQSMPVELMQPHLAKDKTLKISVKGFNKTLTKKDKLERIESFSYLPIQGKVCLNRPTTSLHLIEYYGLSPHNIPQKAFKMFFGRWVSDGHREAINQYTLKKRNFIGSTSMDAQLAFMMTNMAQIEPGMTVADPFVGTGSILVSAAERGAYVWGWDIDFLTLHAKTKPTRSKVTERKTTESIASNLSQYGLSKYYLDVVVMDSSKPMWRHQKGLIDAVITDPPYGIRESTERVFSIKVSGKNSDSEMKQSSRQNSECDSDLSANGEIVLNKLNDIDLCKSNINGSCDDTQNLTNGDFTDLKSSQKNTNYEDNGENCDIDDKNVKKENEELIHYPARTCYSLSSMLCDLLNFCAINLRVGGRLVYWCPIVRDKYSTDNLPSHPCLSLEHNCEQVLNTHSSRRMLTMVKYREPEVGETASAFELSQMEEFRSSFFKASMTLTKADRKERKCLYPRDKRGQGLGYRLKERAQTYTLNEEGNLILKEDLTKNSSEAGKNGSIEVEEVDNLEQEIVKTRDSN